jgi:hypothetical protein
MGFVLYGGTGIALRIGHRSSVDFDFFTEQPLDKSALTLACEFVRRSTVVQDTPDTWTVVVPGTDQINGSVKISFFGTIDFGRVGTPELTDDDVLMVASGEDLLATKLKVILQRAEAKDYRDVLALLTHGVDLGRGLAAARAIYGRTFQPSESLKALAYFEEGDLATLSSQEKQALIAAAKGIKKLPSASILDKKLTASV